jgi:hypothetical protein
MSRVTLPKVVVAVAALLLIVPAPWTAAQDVVRPNDETPAVEGRESLKKGTKRSRTNRPLV